MSTTTSQSSQTKPLEICFEAPNRITYEEDEVISPMTSTKREGNSILIGNVM